MRLLVFLLAFQMVLAGCSQDGGFHASRSVTPTDETITPKNPMVIQPRGEKANPHVLGFLEVSDAVLEKNSRQAELNFQALISLKTGQNQVRWSSKVALRGSLMVDGTAVLYPVNGDVAGELPVRARVTCLSAANPVDCDQAIIDVFVKEGDKTHAAQVLAEMRENVPPESFTPPKKEEPAPTAPDEQEAREDALPPLSGGPERRYANGKKAREERRKESEETLAPPSSGPQKRYANGPAAREKRKAEEKRRHELLQERMNPEVPEADEATVALLQKKHAERKAAEEKRQAELRARMNPENPPLTAEQKAVEEALKKKYAPRTTPKQDRLPRAAPETDGTPKTAPKTERLPKKEATPPVADEPAPGKAAPQEKEEETVKLPETAPIPQPRPRPEEDDEDEAEEEEAGAEGVDPSERPSLFIGTLHESSDELFEKDRPDAIPDQVPVPTPRPEPKKEEPSAKGPTPPNTSAGSRPRDQVIGLANKGSLQNASDMTKKSSTAGFKVIRPERNRHYGSYELVTIIEYLAKFAQSRKTVGPLQVGDLSRAAGGKIPNSKHASHQNGLDVDISYPMNGKNPAFSKMVTPQGKVSSDLKVNETWALMKAAWATKAMDRVFMDIKIKQALCQVAKKTGELDANGKGSAAELLRRIRPTPGHATHFHLRILCSKDQPRCRMIGDPPHGSGC